MRALQLLREAQDAYATFGSIVDEHGGTLCVTLELPWRDNAHDISCIPPGTYHAQRVFSPKHQRVLFQLIDVPGRSAIEIHPGNTPNDSLGCILVGTAFGEIDGQRAVLASRAAFARLMITLEAEAAFELTVSNPPPPLA